ncbi:hypothetical protein ABN028_24230 [Actinopolymorpha sp. B17G11]|uniref:hypothetical protein n=1 Tax=unclassified Actinopolymorpha TaxID=2627063 RepID=UPI0032D8DA55
MEDWPASTSGSTLQPDAQQMLVETARRVVGMLVAGLAGFDAGIAQRNAWEATCADLQRLRIDTHPNDVRPPE